MTNPAKPPANPQAWSDHTDRTPARLHVLQILGNAVVGGMEISVTRVVREWRGEPIRVSALCPFESRVTALLREAGANVLIAPIRDDPVWSSVQLAAAFVVDERVDVVHAHLANAHALGALVSGLTARPCLATIHGRTVSLLDLEAHRLADDMHMSVVCQAAYAHARAVGVARERLHLVPNGVPCAEGHAHSRALTEGLGLAADAPLVGFVGRLSPEKAPDLFVRMAAQLSVTHPRVAFVVIGDGPMRKRLEDDAHALDIASRLHFLGERHDVPALLPSLAVLVVPSHAEGMPLALMEGMAAGLPVVATSVGGMPELVQPGETGMLVGAGDAGNLAIAVAALLDDPEWSASLGARARERASALWPQTEAASRMADLLRRVAASALDPADTRPASAARVRLAGRVAPVPGNC